MRLTRYKLLPCRLLLSLAAFFPVGFYQPESPPSPLLPSIGTPESITAAFNAPEFTGCTAQQVPAGNPAFEQDVIELVNAERASRGLPPLKRIPELDSAARYHAADMIQDNYFQHDSYDRASNQLTLACTWSTRVGNFYPGWTNLAENIAGGYSSPGDVMQGWMNSSGHRANILSQNYSEMGIGYANGNGWAQDFGRRPDSFPIVINNEADTTESQTVSLYIYGSWSDYRLRNDSGAWTEWRPFSNTVDWQLPNTAGLHVVSVEVRSGATVSSNSDSIQLSTSAPALPVLNPLPTALHFYYSRAEGSFSPSQAVITPLNNGSQEPLSWNVTVQAGPFAVSPTQGSTPGSFTIKPSAGNRYSPGSYSGSILLTITSPANVNGSPHQISLVLEVIDRPFGEVFLPILWTKTSR